MMKRSLRGLTVLGALAALGTGCIDLEVTNTQAPDRDQALAEPEALEALIGGTFDVYFGAIQNNHIVNHIFAVLADQSTSVPWWGAVPQTREPRPTFDNSPDVANFTGPRAPREIWSSLNEVLSSTNDGLHAIRHSGVEFEGENATQRAEAFAKFMQGMAWGYLSTIFDQVIVIPDDEEDFDFASFEAVRERLVPHGEALEAAIGALDDAIAIAEQHSFTFPTAPSSWLFFGTSEPLTSTQFIQLANTMKARLLVLSARTPADREALDWNRVLEYTGNGLTYDFATTLDPLARGSWLMSTSQAIIEVSSNMYCCYRLNYRTVGPADTSGGYQAWISESDVNAREPFLIETPDRRITGETPTSHGAYVRFRSNHNGFSSTDGTYRMSHYQWGRHAVRTEQSLYGSGYQAGTALLATVDENRLYRAEALLRLGDRQGAADLINVTRTRERQVPRYSATTAFIGLDSYPGLPPVTADGVPQGDDCVPRTDAGACGDLLTALRYERTIELLNLDAIRGWADGRGFGTLPDGTLLHFAPPGYELNQLGLPVYSFGGVGDEYGAIYDPATLD